MEPHPRRQFVRQQLARVLERDGWDLIAWAVLPNHYHIVVRAPDTGAHDLARWMADLHKYTSRSWNQEDSARGRRIWWNYWDTCIESLGSFWARVNYVHWNPVKHGLVGRPEDYPFSSYREYLAAEDLDVAALEKAYPFDRVRVRDDF